eukprot:1525666-Pyramimonas_sp.AAC.1
MLVAKLEASLEIARGPPPTIFNLSLTFKEGASQHELSSAAGPMTSPRKKGTMAAIAVRMVSANCSVNGAWGGTNMHLASSRDRVATAFAIRITPATIRRA